MSECILWTGAIGRNGYGTVRVGSAKDGTRRMMGAHRVAWESAHGPIPTGMHVLHECDTPACVNVEHLFLGTHADNVRDMMSKGRHASKLTSEDVAQIRSRRANGETQAAIAASFGIQQPMVSKICRGLHWRGE